MSSLLHYLQLCRFNGNPVDFVPSQPFLAKCIAFYLVSGIIVEANISDVASATLEVAMRTVVAALSLAGITLAHRQFYLFKPLLASVFMCENVVITLGIVVEILDDALPSTDYEPYPLILGGLLLLWYLSIISYIVKKVFLLETWRCHGLAVGYFLLTYGLPFLLMEAL